MPSELPPGQALIQVMEGWSPLDKVAFLQRLEAKAKRTGDLEYLREIRAYQRIQASSNDTPPPETPPANGKPSLTKAP